ncbi:MAG: hydrogenase maturation protein HypF [Cryptosporangiaceae bacterium]|nr:hydrogenase maturation protein HypF [Cryptosporangiaceae bacterium]
MRTEIRVGHAGEVASPAAGAGLVLLAADGAAFPGDAIVQAAALLRGGGVLALDGPDGHELAADARSGAAVAALRERVGGRDPFTVMVPSAAEARELAEVSAAEETLLGDPARPVVLLARRPGAELAPAAAPGLRRLGVRLPATSVHRLLLAALAHPIVLTGGNGALADSILAAERPAGLPDPPAVLALWGGREYAIRRPVCAPMEITVPFRRAVLALGAGGAACRGSGRYAFITDGPPPRLIAWDWAPGPPPDSGGADRIAVQRQHAHVAACLADNGEAGPVIGVVLGGPAPGPDGTRWGGDFLAADLTGYTRHGRLSPVAEPAAAEPWSLAASYLDSAYGPLVPGGLAVRRRNAHRWDSALRPPRIHSSAADGLFAAVAAVATGHDTLAFPARELEALADPGEPGTYAVPIGEGATGGERIFEVRADDLVRSVAEDLAAGTPAPVAVMRFHRALAQAIAAGAHRIREATGLDTAALSGSAFENLLLLDLTAGMLAARGFRVLTHRRIPPGDGAVAFGQAVVAGACDAAAR